MSSDLLVLGKGDELIITNDAIAKAMVEVMSASESEDTVAMQLLNTPVVAMLSTDAMKNPIVAGNAFILGFRVCQVLMTTVEAESKTRIIIPGGLL